MRGLWHGVTGWFDWPDSGASDCGLLGFVLRLEDDSIIDFMTFPNADDVPDAGVEPQISERG